MKSISEAYISKLQKDNITSDLGILQIKYALAVLKSELIKTIILCIIFALIGQLKSFLIVMLLILPIRCTTGGIHFNGNISCFLFSLGYFLISVCLLPLLNLDIIVYYLILAISILIIIICPLAPSAKRPIISKKKYLQNKYFSIIYLLIFTIVILTLLKNQYIIAICIWALFLHAIELLFLKLHKKGESKNV